MRCARCDLSIELPVTQNMTSIWDGKHVCWWCLWEEATVLPIANATKIDEALLASVREQRDYDACYARGGQYPVWRAR